MIHNYLAVSIAVFLFLWMTSCRTVVADGLETHGFGDKTPRSLVANPIANPLGLKLNEVSFDWKVSAAAGKQVAYEILVAGDPKKLAADVGTLWESGWRYSDRHVGVVYRGAALADGAEIWWKVRIKTDDGVVGPFSDTARFQTDPVQTLQQRKQTTDADKPVFTRGNALNRVVFLGNTLISRMEKYSFLETAITARWPHHNITFRNLGWPADNVFGTARSEFGSAHNTQSWEPPAHEEGFGYTKLLKQVENARPTTLIVGYGSEAAFTENEMSYRRFAAGYETLLTALEATGAQIILITPPRQEDLGSSMPNPTERNTRLQRAATMICDVAQKRGHRCIDLFEELVAYKPDERLTENGMHLSELGYRRMAELFIRGFGLGNNAPSVIFDSDGQVTHVTAATLGNYVRTNRGFRIDITADSLVSAPTVITAVGDNLLKIDGEIHTQEHQPQWSRGVTIDRGPNYQQAEELRQLIVEKNRLHRYRFRPLNKTYIFLFRRHEMGHLAREVEDFDRLIEEKEELIARLRRPQPHRFELERIKPWKPLQHFSEHYVPENIPAPDIDVELKAFTIADGFEVNLFAANPMIANPINLNWDTRGRAWVSTSSTYPHMKPGHEPNDRIVILEDTNHDGRADKSTVFAEGLLVPHSVMPVDGGAYVCSSTEFLFLADHNGDDRADERRIVYSGFGNADVHHMIHGLRRAPWGELYFMQSLYINSFVETPWGNRRLNGGGVWQFQPETERLEIFVRGMVNPWGLTFDDWGQSFGTDGAFYEGPLYAFPGAAFETAVGAERILPGLVAGKPKYTAAEFISGRHMPERWQGSLLANDFRANRTVRYEIKENGSGYSATEVETVLDSSHLSYTPVDIKMGPEGALYIVDWYNPITGHGEVDFYHPRRDKTHGRVWRLTAKGRPTIQRPQIQGAAINDLLEMLKVPEAWTREQAKRELANRSGQYERAHQEHSPSHRFNSTSAIARELNQPKSVSVRLSHPRVSSFSIKELSNHIQLWLSSLDPEDIYAEHHRLEALWLHGSIGVPNAQLLRQVFASLDHRARAAAVRMASHWKLPNALPMLAKAVEDDHPRVRLEAVNALRQVGSLEAANLALRALFYPVDRDIDYALWLTARLTQDEWLPALKSGETVFDGKIDRITFALSAARDSRAITPLVTLLRKGLIKGKERHNVVRTVSALGDAQALGAVLALAKDEAHLLPAVADGAQANQHVPVDSSGVVTFLEDKHASTEVRTAAVRLSDRWKVAAAKPHLIGIIVSAQAQQADRLAAANALAQIGDFATLDEMATSQTRTTIRTAAISAWARTKPAEAAMAAAGLLKKLDLPQDAALVYDAFASRKEGADVLAQAIAGKKLPANIAAEGVRIAMASGRDLSALINTLTKAGSLQPVAGALTSDQRRALLAEVLKTGDRTRGKEVYERKTLQCVNCHMIDNVGGKLGPDLTSVGASMTPESLLESLLNPSSAIKQGYETVVILRDSGTIVSGTMQRRTGDAALIRDQNGKIVSVPNDDIESMDTSPVSLMPQGLTSTLRRDEFVDLLRYLTMRGKQDKKTN